jgi:rhodanese-related sulfurtransferase
MPESGTRLPQLPGMHPDNANYGSLCGLCCLYVGAREEGVKIPFRTLLSLEYLGSERGSTMAQLEKAARDAGLYAEPLQNLSHRALARIGHSAILHVKDDLYLSDTFDHYLLLLDVVDGHGLVFDPPNRYEYVPLYRLVHRWDGTGLVISSEPLDMGAFLARERWRVTAQAVAACLGLLVVVRLGKRRLPRLFASPATWPGLLGQVTALALVAFGGGMAWQAASATGLLRCPDAAADIQEVHFPETIGEVTRDDMSRILAADAATIVDARSPEEYAAGHLPSALNIPVSMRGDAGAVSALRDFSADRHIVVYCESARCPSGVRVALRLVHRMGYRDVSVYRGGWEDWQAHEKGAPHVHEKEGAMPDAAS